MKQEEEDGLPPFPAGLLEELSRREKQVADADRALSRMERLVESSARPNREALLRDAATVTKVRVGLDEFFGRMERELKRAGPSGNLTERAADLAEAVDSAAGRYERVVFLSNEKEEKQTEPGDRPRITDRPRVRIFELKPPPAVRLSEFADNTQLQGFVADRFRLFRWPAFRWETGGSCGERTGRLNPAQRLGYHYMQPFNTEVRGVLMAHSAGSGKTCGATCIASVFARAGYTPLFVTKKSLKGNYLTSALTCDFNLQQMGSEPRTGERAVSEMRSMGVHFSERHCIMSYREFSNIARKEGGEAVSANRERLRFLRRNPNRGPGARDPLAKCIVVVDEAHLLITGSADQSDLERGNFFAMQELIWNSYARSSPEEAVRVVLLTATPVAQYAVDLVNLLSLLSEREKWPSRIPRGGREWTTAVRERMDGAFRRYMREGGSGALEELRELAKGRISYLDLSGDGNRFARPLVSYVTVSLTSAQLKGIRSKCRLEIERGGRWRLRGGGGKRGRKGLADCVKKGLNWPVDKTQRETDAVGDWRTMTENSQLLVRMLRDIERNRIDSGQYLRTYYRQEGGGGLRYLKQFVFTDLGANKYADRFGVALVAKMLSKMYGYVTINPVSGGKMQPTRAAPPYKGMIVLGSGGEFTGAEKRVTDLLRLWNSPENADGKRAYLFLASGKYREGISVGGVGYISLFGHMPTRAGMVQAVARGIRNCMHRDLPFLRGQGWPVHVRVYTPVSSAFSPAALIKELNREEGDEAVEAMNDFLRKEAYDRYLFEPINRLSKEISDRVQLPP